MTVSKRLKARLVEALDQFKPDEAISVVDAKQLSDKSLPTLAVEVSGVSAHSEALYMVELINLTITLQVHTGDGYSQDTLDDWVETIETTLHNADEIIPILNDGIKVFHFLYNGSDEEWDDDKLSVNFYVDALATRNQ